MNYTNKYIIQALIGLCDALKIDINSLICSMLPTCSNEGIAFVSTDTIKSLLDKYRILVAHPIKTPQQIKKYNEDEWDCTYPYKFLAYPVLKRYEEQLIKYFPLCKDSIKYYAQKTDKFEFALNEDNYFLEIGCDYIITDFVSLGIWG